MKESRSDITVLLNNDVAKNIASLGFFSNYPLLDYYIENNSALIFGKSDHLWAHIISSSPAELSKLLSRHHNITEYYYSVEEWMIPLIEKFGEIYWIMTTNRYILDDNISTKKPEIKITPIDISYSSYIYENSDYRKYTSLDYINERLTNDISAGVFSGTIFTYAGFPAFCFLLIRKFKIFSANPLFLCDFNTCKNPKAPSS
jgi:hypothetical protein